MVGTFEAIAVALIAVIPGAAYIWAVERRVGRWGAGLPDMVFRYLGTSVSIHLLFAPLTYWLWSRYVVSGDLGAGRPISWSLWGLVAAYYVGPFALGLLMGTGVQRDWRLVRELTTIRPPTAWDHLFSGAHSGWLKIKLKSGEWIGGWFGEVEGIEAYASGYPHPRELFLPLTVEIDKESGKFVVDASRRPFSVGPGILVRWDEIGYIKFSEAIS